MTRLPPAQDITAIPPSQHRTASEILLDDATPIRTNITAPSSKSSIPSPQSRLRSVAKYGSFHPQVLACSTDIIATCYKETSEAAMEFGGPSSLGAIAGPRGVALFRTSRPHIPLLIFSHAINSLSSTNSISSLEFQPSHQKSSSLSSASPVGSLFLAAARGSGVLLWDASGHSSNPLLGRLLVDPVHDVSTTTSAGGTPAHHITSIDWKMSPASACGSEPLLVTTTASTLSLWDLRALGTQGGLKPSLRFGNSRRSPGVALAPLLQAACSSISDECATIDASGVVCIYDLRMTERGRSSIGSPVGAFVAHDAGVGIQHLPLDLDAGSSGSWRGHSAWVTWGIETLIASAVVKVWSNVDSSTTREPDTQASQSGNLSANDYMYMSDESTLLSSPNPQKPMPLPTASIPYQLVAQCTKSNISCARACAAPVKNSLVVVGMDSNSAADVSAGNEGETGWWAEVFSLRTSSSEDTSSKSIFGLSRIAGFQGGASSSNADKKVLSNMLGNVSLGQLQASELAFSSAAAPDPWRVEDGNTGSQVPDDFGALMSEMELVLCCLSDTGVITTSAIPEALPKQELSRNADMGGRPSPPTKKTRASDFVITPFPPSTVQTQIFQDIKEGNTLLDLAGIFSGKVESGLPSGIKGTENRTEKRSTSPLKSSGLDDTLRETSRRTDMGMFMQFDMDVPVQAAYDTVNTGNVGGLSVAIPGITSNAILGTSPEDAESSVRGATSIMMNIETARIPCPRLCGASFGSGNGSRLVMFHNGEVNKMWNWYQKTDMIRLSNVPEGQVHTATTSNPSVLMSKTSQEANEKNEIPLQSLVPRSLKELNDMVAKAKEAQWGETNDASATPDDAMSVLEKYFEDESLDSNSDDSCDDDDDDDDEDDLAHPGDEIYKRYFGNRCWRGNQMKDSMVSGKTSATYVSVPRARPSLRLSTDMLAPVVTVISSDKDVMNGQNLYFAKRWKLGKWGREGEESRINQDLDALADNTPIAKPVLPHYRDLVSTQRGGTFTRTRSDPNISKTEKQRKSCIEQTKDEPGVHGGYYTVRPNIQESMTFLNKLYSHQKEAGTTFPTLITPPDSPVLLIQRYSSGGRAGARSRVPGVPLEKRHFDIQKLKLANLGVHTLSIPKHDGDPLQKELEEILRLCEYNAKVCEDFGDEEKKSVWELFADTVQGHINDDDKIFNGWGGKGGGALGVDMISHFFDYYEKLGDVQMLATMFCVLSGGYREDKNKDHAFFLLKGRDAVYDTYIIRYAELLYSWGLLHIRAELNKHLKYPPANEHEFQFLSGEQQDSFSPGDSGSNNTGRADGGLSLTVLCPTCGSEIQPNNSGFCAQCQNFAFRCSICDMAVRGLFTFCETCHHGGHLNHIVEWFSRRNAVCPTGCGCLCSDFTTPLSSQQPNVSLSVAEDMGVMAPQELGFAATL